MRTLPVIGISPRHVQSPKNPETPKSLKKRLLRGVWDPRPWALKNEKKPEMAKIRLKSVILWTFQTFLGGFFRV